MDDCAKCGNKLSWTEKHAQGLANPVYVVWQYYPEHKGKRFCKTCQSDLIHSKRDPRAEQPFKDALEEGRRIVVVKDYVLSADGIGKHIELCSSVAEKFGYIYKSETHFPDSIGISLSIIFERAITTENETRFVVCQYCKARFDANKFFKCPQCGSPTT